MYKVAISGKANAGKNTVSRILCDLLKDKIENDGLSYNGCKLSAFADPIKEIALKMFPHIPKKHLFGSSKYRAEIISGAHKDGNPLTIRQLLIDIGTQGRKYNPNVWIDNFNCRFNSYKKNGTSIVIISDMRFANEHRYLKENNFNQIRVLRSTHVQINDISETGQNDIQDNEFDYILHNEYTLTALREDIETNIIPLLKNQ